MRYEINVSKNGRHFFATAPRSLINREDMVKALAVFVEKFPESEGYDVQVSRVVEYGESLDVEEILKGN